MEDALGGLGPIGDNSLEGQGSVWTTVGDGSVTNRSIGFIDNAEDEIVLVLNGIDEERISGRLVDRLRAAGEQGVAIYIGTLSESTYEQVTTALPEVRTSESGLEWLQPQTEEEHERIGRLLLVDRSVLLLSSLGSHEPEEETAIWSDSVGNGLLILARRLLASGLDRETEDFDETAEEGTQENQ